MKITKALLTIASLLVATSAWGDTDTTWNPSFEASPGDSDVFSEGPIRIRDLKDNIRDRLETEHEFGTAESNDTGLHHMGSARCFVQNTAPTLIENNDFAVSGDGVDDIGAVGSTGTTFIGHGRCWVDRDGADGINGNGDDGELYLYDEDPNGDASKTDAAWISVGHPHNLLGPNLLPCGGFDCMIPHYANDGVTEIAHGAGLSNDSLPHMGAGMMFWGTGLGIGTEKRGWQDGIFGSGSPVASWKFSETDASEGGGTMVTVSTDVSLENFSYIDDSLKTNTLYYMTVRAKKVSGNGSCGMWTTNMETGSGVNLSNTAINTTSSSFVTLGGYFRTGSSLGTGSSTPRIHINGVTVVSGSVVCSYDHGGFFEVFEGVDGTTAHALATSGSSILGRQIGQTRFPDENSSPRDFDISDSDTGTHWQDAPVLRVTTYVPNNSYYLRITAGACVEATTPHDWYIEMRLEECGIAPSPQDHDDPVTGAGSNCPGQDVADGGAVRKIARVSEGDNSERDTTSIHSMEFTYIDLAPTLGANTWVLRFNGYVGHTGDQDTELKVGNEYALSAAVGTLTGGCDYHEQTLTEGYPGEYPPGVNYPQESKEVYMYVEYVRWN